MDKSKISKIKAQAEEALEETVVRAWKYYQETLDRAWNVYQEALAKAREEEVRK